MDYRPIFVNYENVRSQVKPILLVIVHSMLLEADNTLVLPLTII